MGGWLAGWLVGWVGGSLFMKIIKIVKLHQMNKGNLGKGSTATIWSEQRGFCSPSLGLEERTLQWLLTRHKLIMEHKTHMTFYGEGRFNDFCTVSEAQRLNIDPCFQSKKSQERTKYHNFWKN